jgi:phenylpyruvate tautomerase PptA (4-oxalocrotonate tautomerase family)
MPVLKIETNQTLSQEQTAALMEKSTNMLCSVLGKDKTYMMVYVDAGCSMMFNGSTEPFAFVQLRQFAFEEDQAAGIIKGISTFIADELQVNPDRQYIQLTEMENALFGWDGKPC